MCFEMYSFFLGKRNIFVKDNYTVLDVFHELKKV